MKLEYFKIDLQRPAGVFRPGETVAGTISYRVLERAKINKVTLAAVGRGYCRWTESQGSGKDRRDVTYTGSEQYFQFQEIYEAKAFKEDYYLEAGNYSHQFQFVLPPVLPTSIEHHNGHIRYSIVGTIDIPWSFNRNCEKRISVIGHVDLNTIPALGEPAKATQSKTMCCFCCASEPIIMTLTTRKSGYVAGETVHAEVSIENPTSRQIFAPTITLRQKLVLHATSRSKTMFRSASSVRLANGIAKKSNEHYTGIELAIPPTCPSTLDASRVFAVSYQLHVHVPISGPTMGAEIVIPIVIGTVPIGGAQQQQQQSSPWSSVQPSAFGGASEAPGLPDENLTGEAVSSDAKTFQPQYPYFKDFSIRS